jgi:hypothetical protein
MSGTPWRVLSGGLAGLMGSLTERGLRVAWKAALSTDPPEDPEDPDTSWKEAAAWAVLSGALIGLSRLVVMRKATAYYRRSTKDLR